jgi:rhamnose utilization protein RhaD (predicted bifunctional aldolase and dehydrogenase)
MTNAKTVLRELIEMSREIGRPERDLVILGEGNTSAVCDDGTFWVKASGTQLRTPNADTFVRLWLKPVCELADQADVSDDAFKAALAAAKVDPSQPKRPSTETVLHALALTEMGAAFVGHTHPVAINALMCSVAADTMKRSVPSGNLRRETARDTQEHKHDQRQNRIAGVDRDVA